MFIWILLDTKLDKLKPIEMIARPNHSPVISANEIIYSSIGEFLNYMLRL